MDQNLFENDDPDKPEKGNTPAFSVSEISGALKRVVEDRFAHVRVRGEIGRCTRPASGHFYLSLKDDRAVIDGVIWKGTARRLPIMPEEGMEVIVTGKLTTYPGSSKYQIVIESFEPAGAGALMAMLEARKKALAAEGLFDEERKRAIPVLPEVIGVVTSPSGAVIRDILHRLADRFPRRVLVWPVAVQGKACAPEVSAALHGFNALAVGGSIPRPDLLIVARGGGSLEDLWGFNEEAVARAVAASEIPVIAAVGHETDVTLVDYVADLRAPTPTAAAEKAVPVRSEMAARLTEQGLRGLRAVERMIDGRREVVRQTARALPKPAQVLGEAQQRLDLVGERLRGGLRIAVGRNSERFARARGRLSPSMLSGQIKEAKARLKPVSVQMRRSADLALERRRESLRQGARTLEALSYRRVLDRGYVVVRGEEGIVTAAETVAAGDALTLEFANEKMVPVRAEAGRKAAGARKATAERKTSEPKTTGKTEGAKDTSAPRPRRATKSETKKADQPDLFGE